MSLSENKNNMVVLGSVATNILLVGVVLGYLFNNHRDMLPPPPPMQQAPHMMPHPGMPPMGQDRDHPHPFVQRGMGPHPQEFHGHPPRPMPEIVFASLLEELPREEASLLRSMVDKEKEHLHSPKRLAQDMTVLLDEFAKDKPDIDLVKEQLKVMWERQKAQTESMDRLILGAIEKISPESRKLMVKKLRQHIPFGAPQPREGGPEARKIEGPQEESLKQREPLIHDRMTQ